MIKALTISGGGANGEAASAQIARLAKPAEPWSIFTGESIGAAQAYMTALDGPAAALRFWDAIKPSDIFRGGGWLEKAATGLGLRHGLFDMEPARKTLAKLAAGRRLPAHIRVVVTVTDMVTGALLPFELNRDTPPALCVERVWRSCLVPLAHKIPGGRYADGGVSFTAPLAPAIGAGADHVDVILLDRLGTSEWAPTEDVLPLAGRAIGILRENLFWADLQGTWLRNQLSDYRKITASYYEPDHALPPWMDFEPQAKQRRRLMTFTGRTLDETYWLVKALRDNALAKSLKETTV